MFKKENSASANFMLAATAWIVFGVLMGLVLALQFVFPDLFRGVPWLVFGRLRQAHTNTVTFAFLSGGIRSLTCSPEAHVPFTTGLHTELDC
jgi:cbb3-type cytochrome oxidase subunit 1